MIHYIIYSKNRAAQLDLLLQSIDKFTHNLIICSIIYLATTPNFLSGYNHIFKNYDYKCVKQICLQNNFKQDAIDLIQDSQEKLIGFFTDDTVVYKNIPYMPEELFNIMQDWFCNSFSLRNGFNTEEQCHYEKYFTPLKTIKEYNGFIMWDTSQYSYGTDFGRPISIDGNFFVRDVILPMLINGNWNDPRSLDGLPIDPLGKNMMAFRHSVAVNIPVNLACDGYTDNWGRFIRQSLESLNTECLQGKRIDLDSIDFSNICSSHQELELKFK
jgi:hypothetical protein